MSGRCEKHDNWHAHCQRCCSEQITTLRAENVRLTARVAELGDRHARPAFQHLDGAHIVEPHAECVLCAVIKERDAARAEAESLMQQRGEALAELESLKAQLAEAQRTIQTQTRELAWTNQRVVKGWAARAESAEEQLRVAREALKALLSKFKSANGPPPYAEGEWGRFEILAEDLHAMHAALSASAPRAEPILDEDGEWSGPSEHEKRRAALMRVAEAVAREYERRADLASVALGDVDLAAIVSEVAP